MPKNNTYVDGLYKQTHKRHNSLRLGKCSTLFRKKFLETCRRIGNDAIGIRFDALLKIVLAVEHPIKHKNTSFVQVFIHAGKERREGFDNTKLNMHFESC